jgi:polyisoprenoid-binding protein YceI
MRFTRPALALAARIALLAGVACLASAAQTKAQQPEQPPPGLVFGVPDAKLAPAGSYSVDPDHTAVLARISHIGYGLSVFRFGKVAGTLAWDPAAPAKSKLSATVDTGSIQTPVVGFAAELVGPQYLDAAKFPQATFTTTAFRQTDATHGKVDGLFTLLGKTKPISFDVTLIGAGPGFFGHPRLGIHAEAAFDPQDYGLAPVFGHRAGLVIDSEFQKS